MQLLLHCTCYAIYFCLVESIPQFLELWPISMHFDGPSSFTLLYRNATSYGIKHLIVLHIYVGGCFNTNKKTLITRLNYSEDNESGLSDY